jgi:hypothetical protein
MVWYANDPTSLASGMKLGDTAVVVSKTPVTAEYRKSKPYVIYDVNDIYQADGLPTIPRWHFLHSSNLRINSFGKRCN